MCAFVFIIDWFVRFTNGSQTKNAFVTSENAQARLHPSRRSGDQAIGRSPLGAASRFARQECFDFQARAKTRPIPSDVSLNDTLVKDTKKNT